MHHSVDSSRFRIIMLFHHHVHLYSRGGGGGGVHTINIIVESYFLNQYFLKVFSLSCTQTQCEMEMAEGIKYHQQSCNVHNIYFTKNGIRQWSSTIWQLHIYARWSHKWSTIIVLLWFCHYNHKGRNKLQNLITKARTNCQSPFISEL